MRGAFFLFWLTIRVTHKTDWVLTMRAFNLIFFLIFCFVFAFRLISFLSLVVLSLSLTFRVSCFPPFPFPQQSSRSSSEARPTSNFSVSHINNKKSVFEGLWRSAVVAKTSGFKHDCGSVIIFLASRCTRLIPRVHWCRSYHAANKRTSVREKRNGAENFSCHG